VHCYQQAAAAQHCIAAASIASKVLRDTSLLVEQGALAEKQAGSLDNGYPS
jgi:ribonuclease HII